MSAGGPTDEEIGAVVVVLAVLAARAPSAETEVADPPALWRDRSAGLHTPLVAGRGSWRASALPR